MSTNNEEIKVTADLSPVDAQLRRLQASLVKVTETVGALQAKFDQFHGGNFKALRSELAQLNTALNVLRKGDILPQFKASAIQGQVATFKNEIMKLGEEMALAQAGALSKAQRANKFNLKQQVTEQAVFGGLDLKGKDLDTLKRYEKILSEAKSTADISRELEKSKEGMKQLTQVSERLGQVLGQIRSQVQQITQAQREQANLNTPQVTASRQQLGAAAQDRDIYRKAIGGQLEALSSAELKRAEKLVAARAAEARGLAEQLKTRQGMERHAQRALQVEQNLLAVRQQITAEARRQTAINSWDTTMERLGANGGANLLALQARLMANYATIGLFTGALRFAIGFVREFDQELHQLQAISAASDEAMKGLKETVIEVSQGTKFTAVEVAQAATVLAQAGFSVREVQDSLKGVTLLATATGSSLAQAVDVATAAVGVFNMQAAEMGQVANITTQALNLSKLTMDKLALGLQYSANIAADAGLTYTELTAVLATMANTGIRSGSTMGTGLRQVLMELMDPSKKLRDRFDELGISMAEIDLKTQGFVGVMENLRRKGFTSADAFALMETRTAAAFSAINRGADSLVKLETAFTLNNAAARANEVQMRSLDTITKVLQSNFGAMAEAVSGDLLFALKELLKALSDVTKWGYNNADAIKTVVNALAALTAVGIGLWLARLTAGLAGTVLGFRHLLDTVRAVPPATAAAAASLSTLTGAANAAGAAGTKAATGMALMRGAALRLGLVGVAFAALSFLPELFNATATEAEKAAAAYDKARGELEKLQGQAEAAQTTIDSLNGDINRYIDRYGQLQGNADALNLARWESAIRYRDIGFDVDAIKSVDDLISKLKELEQQQRQTQLDQVVSQVNKMSEAVVALNENIRKTADAQANLGFMGKYDKSYFDAQNVRGKNASVDDALKLLDRVAAGEPVALAEISKAALTIGTRQRELRQKISEGLLSGIEADWAAVEMSVMDTLKARLESVEALNLELAGKKVELGILESRKQELAFWAGEAGNRVNELFTDTERALEQLVKALKTADTIEEAQALAEAIQGLSEQHQEAFLREQREAIEGGMGEMMAAAKAADKSKELIDRMGSEVKTAMATINDMKKEFLEDQLKVLEDQLKLLMLEAEKGLNAGLEAQIRNIVNKSANIQTELAGIQSKDNAFLKANPAEQAAYAETQAKLIQAEADKKLKSIKDAEQRRIDQSRREAEREQEQRRRIAAKQAEAYIKLLEDDMEKTLTLSGQETAEDFKKRLAVLSSQSEEYIKRSVEEFRKSLEEDKAFEGQGDLINRLVASKERDLYQKVAANSDKLIQAMIASADRAAQQANAEREFQASLVQASRAGQSTTRGEANFTEADAFAQREADELLRVAQVQDQINTLRKQSADYSTALAAAEAEQARYGELNVEGQKKITDLKEKILEVDRRRLALEQELIALSSDEQASLEERLDAATRLYMSQSGALKTLDTQIVELYSVGLKSLGDGFSTLFKDIVTGAKTGGDALRGMVLKFAEALLDETVQNAASGFMSMLNGGKSKGAGGIFSALLSGIGSLFGGGGSVGRTGYTSGILGPAGTMVGGRSRGGKVDATDLGRDSVLVPLRGQEYVLQPSAARSIGYDFLDRMNQLGAAAIPREIVPAGVIGGGRGGEVNVYVVAPDEQPQMGPNDVIATISRDILTGGTTKRLIKSVAMGQA